MPIPCWPRGFARGALSPVLIAILAAVITSQAAIDAQKDQSPLALWTLVSQSFPERIKVLEQRRERQLSLGLTEDAERTAQEIARLQQERQQRCSALWNFTERAQQGPMSAREARELSKQVPDLTKDTSRFYECGKRPGTGAGDDPNDQLPRFDTQAALRRQIESQDSMTRSLLFVEPLLSTATGADVPNPVLAVIAEVDPNAPDPGPNSDRDAFLKLTAVLTREGGRDVNRVKAVLEEALAATPDAPHFSAYVLEMLRTVDQQRGDTAGALAWVQTQLDLVQRTYGAASPRVCFPLWYSIPLLIDSQRPDDAVAAARRCLELVPKDTRSLTYASALSNLGLALHRTGALPRAVDLYQQSLTVLSEFPVSLSTAAMEVTRQPPHLTVRANLGLAFWQAGELQLAAEQFAAARVLMMKESQWFFTEGIAVVSLAKLEAEIDALVSLERDVAARVPGPPPLLALPMLLERKGLALEEKAAAVKIFAQDPGNLTEYRSLLALRARLARGTPTSPGDPASSDQRTSEVDFQIQLLESEARTRTQSAAAFTAGLNPAEQAEYTKYLTELGDEEHRLSLQYFKHPPKNDARSDQERNEQFNRAAKAKVDPKFKKIVARLEAIPRGVREELLSRIQTSLPADAVLVEMLRYRPLNVGAATEAERWQPAHYGAYLIKREGVPTFIDFGESTPIDDLITEFRRTLAQPRGTLAHDLGRRLDAILMQPVRAALGTATTIHLAPDGALNLVPFAAFVDEDDRYLIERFTFDYLSSGRDLLRPVSAAPAVTMTVVIGDPAFDGTVVEASTQSDATLTRGLADQRFDPLPGTAAEARAIGRLLGKSTVLTGANATETAIKSVEAPRVLHIATHGFFLADQDLSAAADGRVAGLEDPMLRSGLVFAGANIGRSGTDDGVLTAFEAGGLNLSGTQLVVLSACETGVGEVRNGEGVFGLRRAFMVAGAETLVMSLWQVEDTATEQLMTEFYRRLSSGQGRAEALRQASLTLMRDPSRRHPFFWGSFIASGAAGPLHR